MNVERAPFRSSGAPAETLEPHAKVRIHGLSARAELNSCGGTILCWHADKGRYGVQVEGSLETVLLRPTNLEEVKPPRVREKWAPEWRSAEARPPCFARALGMLPDHTRGRPLSVGGRHHREQGARAARRRGRGGSEASFRRRLRRGGRRWGRCGVGAHSASTGVGVPSAPFCVHDLPNCLVDGMYVSPRHLPPFCDRDGGEPRSKIVPRRQGGDTCP